MAVDEMGTIITCSATVYSIEDASNRRRALRVAELIDILTTFDMDDEE